MIFNDLTGSSVAKIEHYLPVTMRTDTGWVIQIENDMQMSITAAGREQLNRESPELPGRLRKVVEESTVTAATMTDGVLELQFSSGIELVVEPDPEFESWNIVGPSRQRVICAPGGELVYFPGLD
ncbi:DUF6188 family protein [Salininema proteolyticum]|uniref:DUF6188 family protein n=1 Tax=Salininema proteolyticum TaxID=1607685 RepID=A0ABV8U4M1_9ACTN